MDTMDEHTMDNGIASLGLFEVCAVRKNTHIFYQQFVDGVLFDAQTLLFST